MKVQEQATAAASKDMERALQAQLREAHIAQGREEAARCDWLLCWAGDAAIQSALARLTL